MSCPALPEGWKREECRRSGGLYSGRIEIVYISPCGKKIKSKTELSQFLGSAVDLTTFDWRTGRINAALLRNQGRNKRSSSGRTGLYDYRNLQMKLDNSLTPPIRQNSGIFKRPVKVVSSQSGLNWHQIKDYFKRNNMMLSVEPKQENPDKPYQVFFHKRLQGIHTTRPLGNLADFQLPSNMKAFMSSLADNESLLRSITASLHLGTMNIRGQEKSSLQKKRDPVEGERMLSPRNPVAFVNPQQPLILNTTITEDDIRRQEEVIADTRLKLISAIRDVKLVSAKSA